jgi:hypothetical protein
MGGARTSVRGLQGDYADCALYRPPNQTLHNYDPCDWHNDGVCDVPLNCPAVIPHSKCYGAVPGAHSDGRLTALRGRSGGMNFGCCVQGDVDDCALYPPTNQSHGRQSHGRPILPCTLLLPPARTVNFDPACNPSLW